MDRVRGERNRPPQGPGVNSELSSKPGGQVLEEVVKVAVPEVQLLQDCGDLLAFLAGGSQDPLDDHVGGDDVGVAGGGAGDHIGPDVEVLLSEKSFQVHDSER